MDAFGTAASAVGLIALLYQIKSSISTGRGNILNRLPLLLHHVETMVKTLEQFPQGTRLIVFNHVSSELQKIDGILKSINQRSSRFIWLYGLQNDGMLREVDDRLRYLHLNFIITALAGIASNMPRVINVISQFRPELPTSGIGLDRIREPLQFLQGNKTSKRLSIIAIHGEPGLGKTTLLNKLWHDVFSEKDFSVMAYGQLKEYPDPESLCFLQSSILQQLLGGDCDISLPSSEFGRGALNKRLMELKINNMSVFLALDNVWGSDVLEVLLPSGLDSLLPPSSCIVVTSGQANVDQTLRNLCGDINNYDILSYKPRYFSPRESAALFAAHANIPTGEHAEIIKNIVPLCRGLPLTLKVCGSLFKRNAQGERTDWREVYAAMQVQVDGSLPEVQAMVKGLQLSYDRLHPDCQKAFLDVAGFFYGWRWSTVECIIDKRHMWTLKDCYLISEAESKSLCNKSAINSFGCPSQPWENCPQSCLQYGELLEGKVVTMHDSIRKFGKFLLDNNVHRAKIDRRDGDLTELGQDNLLGRSRFLWKRSSQQEMILPKNQINNLLFLHLESSLDNSRRLILNVETQPSRSYQDSQNSLLLRFQSLENVTSSAIFTMISPELRELHFHKCPSLKKLLPKYKSLKKLERLHIRDCIHFQGMPEFCDSWRELRELFLSRCERIVTLPTTLGNLQNLKILVVKECIELKSFPDLMNLKQLLYLEVGSCRELANVPALPENLKILILSHCLNIHQLPADSICCLTSLEILEVRKCSALSELPEEMGKLKSLKNLHLSYCCSVKKVPDSICSLTSLETFDVRECTALLEFPEEMGNLKSLKNLDLSYCSRVNKLPDSICSLTSLETFDMRECTALSELPEEMGNLKSLKNLDLSYCSRVKMLPDSICDIAVLEVLDVQKCSKLSKLPEKMEKLTQLQKLKVWGCESLQYSPRLADGIVDWNGEIE